MPPSRMIVSPIFRVIINIVPPGLWYLEYYFYNNIKTADENRPRSDFYDYCFLQIVFSMFHCNYP